jgi:hypothetical protein
MIYCAKRTHICRVAILNQEDGRKSHSPLHRNAFNCTEFGTTWTGAKHALDLLWRPVEELLYAVGQKTNTVDVRRHTQRGQADFKTRVISTISTCWYCKPTQHMAFQHSAPM